MTSWGKEGEDALAIPGFFRAPRLSIVLGVPGVAYKRLNRDQATAGIDAGACEHGLVMSLCTRSQPRGVFGATRVRVRCVPNQQAMKPATAKHCRFPWSPGPARALVGRWDGAERRRRQMAPAVEAAPEVARPRQPLTSGTSAQHAGHTTRPASSSGLETSSPRLPSPRSARRR